jgi:hypothetical protein
MYLLVPDCGGPRNITGLSIGDGDKTTLYGQQMIPEGGGQAGDLLGKDPHGRPGIVKHTTNPGGRSSQQMGFQSGPGV